MVTKGYLEADLRHMADVFPNELLCSYNDTNIAKNLIGMGRPNIYVSVTITIKMFYKSGKLECHIINGSRIFNDDRCFYGA